MSKLGTYTDTPVYATERQINFLTSLTNELYDLSERITGTVDPDARSYALALIPGMSKSAASDRIGSLKSEILPTMRQTLRSMTYTTQTVEAPVSDASDLDRTRVYVKGDRYYRLRKSGPAARRPGQVYAVALNMTTRKFEDYAGYDVAATLTAANIMTAEQGKAFGDLHTWCIRCGADLSDPVSVAQGYGPICAKYFA